MIHKAGKTELLNLKVHPPETRRESARLSGARSERSNSQGRGSTLTASFNYSEIKRAESPICASAPRKTPKAMLASTRKKLTQSFNGNAFKNPSSKFEPVPEAAKKVLKSNAILKKQNSYFSKPNSSKVKTERSAVSKSAYKSPFE